MSDEHLLEASGEATQSNLAEVAAARAARETAWVRKRKGENIDSSEWNPKKRYRFDAFKWLAQTGWQLLQNTGLGFGHFALTAEQRKQKPWHQWPLLNYAGDQGSKEQCGLWVLKRKLQLNMDEVPDQGHGVWNDCKLGLKAIPDLWSHTLLMLLAWNVRHGPWQEDIRFAQVLGNVRNQAKHGKEARQLPLFMSLIDRMVFDQQDPSLVFVDDVPQGLLEVFLNQAHSVTRAPRPTSTGSWPPSKRPRRQLQIGHSHLMLLHLHVWSLECCRATSFSRLGGVRVMLSRVSGVGNQVSKPLCKCESVSE